eukprot:10010-Heterococcus_DN1.PRE.2
MISRPRERARLREIVLHARPTQMYTSLWTYELHSENNAAATGHRCSGQQSHTVCTVHWWLDKYQQGINVACVQRQHHITHVLRMVLQAQQAAQAAHLAPR